MIDVVHTYLEGVSGSEVPTCVLSGLVYVHEVYTGTE